ncbi:xanthine dehydrogenase small subunit [Saccharospirillum impatiens]|uniref:xanthine dehydrogenase small subunit n=1 Tax=Saccharospirillum impatiens TaxID=169438 RepID=UPI00041EE860|nr:xanthine dehydrogenase small subunit [Saccharospirillum impatiens]
MTDFLLNRQPVTLATTDPDLTVLDFLREQAHLTGTKEGCASGDCGACTIVVGEPTEQGMRYRSLNSCITFVHSLHGKQLLTVEHLEQEGALHPVQQALVDHHGSQCGFCTPGFVMSLFALYHSDVQPSRDAVLTALSGNLCRCTGYRPIIDAGMALLEARHGDAFSAQMTDIEAELRSLGTPVLPEETKPDQSVGFWQPKNREELARAKARSPRARYTAGSTDLALEKTQRLANLNALIDLSQVAELNHLSVDAEGLHIGAAVSYTELEPVLLADYPEAREWLERLGSRPIRNRGTLGGNLGNASPIGDTPPLLIALNATVTLSNGQSERTLPVSELITGYRQTVLADDEWIDTIHIPRRTPGSLFRAYKISKRFEDDISTVCAVFYLETDKNDIVTCLRTGFGGLAATPLQLTDWQEPLIGEHWPALAVNDLSRTLAEALAPIDDVRASARYRVQVTANLFKRFHLETTQPDARTRVHGHGGSAHA